MLKINPYNVKLSSGPPVQNSRRRQRGHFGGWCDDTAPHRTARCLTLPAAGCPGTHDSFHPDERTIVPQSCSLHNPYPTAAGDECRRKWKPGWGLGNAHIQVPLCGSGRFGAAQTNRRNRRTSPGRNLNQLRPAGTRQRDIGAG